MIELKITGETTEDFALNFVKAFATLSVGLSSAVNAIVQQSTPPSPPTPASSAGSEPSTAAQAAQSAPPAPATSDQPDTFSKMVEKLDTDVTAEATTTKPPKEAKPKATVKLPKLDDIKTRLSEIITAAAERGWDVDRRNTYARQLLGGFGVQKVSDLKKEDYATFIARSADYLDGSTAEV